MRCLVAGSFQPFLEALRGCEVITLQATPAHRRRHSDDIPNERPGRPRHLTPRPAAPTAVRTDPGGGLSLRRLYVLRFGYLFMGGGLVVFKWPSFIAHDGSWPLVEGSSSACCSRCRSWRCSG